MSDSEKVIGIDLGGTGSRFVLMSAEGVVHARLALSTPLLQDSENSLQFAVDALKNVAGESRLRGVGIGATGPIDAEGIIRNPDTLAAFSNYDFVGALSHRLGLPVYIDNDAVTAALAEYRFGAGKSSKSLLLVTLGTGIGSCLLIDGKPFRGGDGWHPEGGHVDIARRDEACYCGRTSCWETSASRQSLQRIATQKMKREINSIAELDGLAELSLKQDSIALGIFEEYGVRVGEGLANLLGMYRPTDVVIGGGGARYFDQFAPSALKYLEKVRSWIPAFTFKATQLDDFGGAMGAATLVQGVF